MSAFIDIIISLLTLTILEVILGIDNLVFLAIVSQRLPKSQQKLARKIGLTLAWMARLLLLLAAVWIVGLKAPIITILGHGISWRDIFLIVGGLFLLAKSTQEIHLTLEDEEEAIDQNKTPAKFFIIITQIVILDIIFSLDSILTAIGLTKRYWVMATAITIAIAVMLFASEPLSQFINKHPTIKMLALSFLLLIGMMLLADGFEFHIPRGYIYFAMGFSLFVEVLNMRIRKAKKR